MNFTIILVILTGLISYQAFSNFSMKQQLIFHPSSIQERGEWYRFITSGFIHADWGHLIINMFVLYQFGEVVEYLFGEIFGKGLGRTVFILFYVSAIAIASIPSFFKNNNNPYYAALGASGATSAVVFVYVLFDPWQWFLFPPLPGILMAIGYLWYSSYMAKRGTDNIGHDAHFWGALYGVVFIISVAVFYRPELLEYFIAKLMEGPSAPNF